MRLARTTELLYSAMLDAVRPLLLDACIRVGYAGVEPASVLLPKQAAHPEPCIRRLKYLQVSGASCPTLASGPASDFFAAFLQR